jgi:hypothetical protein
MAVLELTVVDAWFAVGGLAGLSLAAAMCWIAVGRSARRHAQRAVEADGLPVEDLVLDDVNGQRGELSRAA